jgi:archaellum component FlaC
LENNAPENIDEMNEFINEFKYELNKNKMKAKHHLNLIF